MRNFYLLVFLLLFNPLFVSAQKSEEARKLRNKVGTTLDSLQINALLDLSWFYMKSQTDSAIFYAKLSLKQSQSLGFTIGEMRSYNALGTASAIAGDYPQAVENHLKCCEVAKKLNRTKGYATIYNNIGNDYAKLKDFKNALFYMNLSLEEARKRNDGKLQISILNTCIQIYLAQNELNEAESSAQKALKLANEIKDSTHLAYTYLNLAEIQTKKKAYEASNTNLLLSMKMRNKHDEYGMVLCYLRLAQNFYKLRKLDGLKLYLSKAEALSLKNKFLSEQSQVSALKASMLESQGKADSALLEYKKHYKLKDSVVNIEKNRYISDLQVKFDTKIKEQELEKTQILLKAEQTKRRVYTFSGILLLFIVGFTVFNIKKRNKILKLENDNAKERIRLEQEERKNMEAKAALELQQEEYKLQLAELEKNRLIHELEKAEIEQQRLSLELDEKHRSLLTNTMQREQQKEFLTELATELNILRNCSDKPQWNYAVDQLSSLIKGKINQADDWDKIKLYFEKVHPDFFDKLKEQYPSLSINDLKLCAYTKMNLNGKEISRLLNINPASVQVSRYRLKRKMGLSEEVNFTDYILQNY